MPGADVDDLRDLTVQKGQDYENLEKSWNVKQQFSYDMLIAFRTVRANLAEHRASNMISQARPDVLENLYSPLEPYMVFNTKEGLDEPGYIRDLINGEEGATVREQFDSLSKAVAAMWSIYAVILGHIIPRKDKRTLKVAHRFMAAREKAYWEQKQRARGHDY